MRASLRDDDRAFGIDHIDYDTHNLLKRKGAGKRAPDRVPTPLGLLISALDNHTSTNTTTRARSGTGQPSLGRIGNARLVNVLSGWNDPRWISKTLSMDAIAQKGEREDELSFDDVMDRERKRRCAYQGNLAYFISHAIYTASQMSNMKQSVVTVHNRQGEQGYQLILNHHVMHPAVAAEMFAALRYLLYEKSKETLWTDHGKQLLDLSTRLDRHPITGDDPFSKAMRYVYAREYPHADKDLASDGLDLDRLIRAIQDSYATEGDQISATIESLKATIMGILFGPMGLSTYARATETYQIDSPFTRKWIAFELCQLFGEDDGRGEPEPALFGVDRPSVTISDSGDYTPIVPAGTPLPHLIIERLEDEDGDTVWQIREQMGGLKGSAICKADDDSVVVLEKGGAPVRIQEGDEIWLNVSRLRPMRNYEKGAVVAFREFWDYAYRDDLAPEDHLTERAVTTESQKGDEHTNDSVGEPIGFSLTELESQRVRQVLYKEFGGAGEPFEFKIGRHSDRVDFACSVTAESGISRVHATICVDDTGQATLFDGEVGVGIMGISMNGTEIVRDGSILPIGKAVFAPESRTLMDGDILCLPSRRTDHATLAFNYLYDEDIPAASR